MPDQPNPPADTAAPEPDERDAEIEVLRGVISRLAQQLAQAAVTNAELDARLQREVAARARTEAT